MGDERQDILDEIDKAADRILDDVKTQEVAALTRRLAKAHGTTSNSATLVALAWAVATLLNDAPAKGRDHLAVVFMRLVQRMMNDEADCGSLH